ncbi:MAG: DUF2163 domain-containing protein [Hyphomicrobiaceae bacterium]
MKTLHEGLRAHIASGVTTLCWCWRLTRKDEQVFGFTDHDRDITFDSTVFEAAAGFSASEITDAVGLAVDNLEVNSALSSDRLDEADLAAGLYDDARVEIFRVNWQDPSQRVIMRTGSLGEVRRAGLSFAAEVRGLAHYLQQPKGRLFQFSCDADLGDTRCGIDASQPAYRASGTVQAVTDARLFTVSGLEAYENAWFSRGGIAFTSGAASGQVVEIKRHTKLGSVIELELWQGAREPLIEGQGFIVTTGCDKHLTTCRDKFSNAVNYRGFPNMPGNDFVAGYLGSGS